MARPHKTVGTILALLAIGGAWPRSARSQAIPSPEYVTYLPREPLKAISATEPSRRFRLYGEPGAPGYRDVAPRNGVDDGRDSLLHGLGVRFAPWMVRNAYGFPVDIRKLIDARQVPLIRDRFNLARHTPVLEETDTLPLAPRAPACAPEAADTRDCTLLALLRERGPQAAVSTEPVTPESDPAEVLYLEFPGEDPKSWAKEYGEAGSGFEVSPRYVGFGKVYLHPFIVERESGADGRVRYDFVLQYWFYYPTNDAGNVHEGDWEHLNVVIAPRERVTEALDEATLTGILSGAVPLDSLVIQRIEYYFHHWFFPVDYSRPNVYVPREQWERERDALETAREGERTIWDAIRKRAYLDAAETRVNLNPLVFIGGNGRGLGLLLRAPGPLGLSSHGSYPFPGLYKAVGPAGTGESIEHQWGLHREAPPREADEREQLIRFDRPDRVEILPDWETLAPLALEDHGVRWDWAWFLLPARSGYPATVSPFAGVIRYAETGNVPPGSPPYNGGWNRLGDGAGYSPFVPHRISSVFPLDLQDTYNARWGFLNATTPTLSLLPPFDLLIRAIERPISALVGRSMPSYARSEDIPARRIGVGLGVTRYRPGETYGNLLGFSELSTPIIQRANDITGTVLTGYGLGPTTFTPMYSWQLELSLHLGDHFVTSNALSHGRSEMKRDLVFSQYPDVPLRAELNAWEYIGSLRWNLAAERLQPFLAAGYGLSWYRLERLTGFGEVLGDSRWIRRPSLFHNLLPNTWHAGGGIELLPSYGFGQVNLGLKASLDIRTHRLGLATGDNTTVFFQDGRITRWVFGLTATLAY